MKGKRCVRGRTDREKERERERERDRERERERERVQKKGCNIELYSQHLIILVTELVKFFLAISTAAPDFQNK